MKIEKRSDIYRELARVMDLCDGIKNVNYWNCIKLRGKICAINPSLSNDLNEYEFAIAVVEDRPVFVGDVLYYKNYRQKAIGLIGNDSLQVVSDDCDSKYNNKVGAINFSDLSWNPPKPKALCQIQGKDIFKGDILYFWPEFSHYGEGKKVKVISHKIDVHGRDCLMFDVTNGFYDKRCFSFTNKPKTFNLNGVELSLPVKEYKRDTVYKAIQIGGDTFCFETIEDLNKVHNELVKLLSGLSDK